MSNIYLYENGGIIFEPSALKLSPFKVLILQIYNTILGKILLVKKNFLHSDYH